MNMKFKVGKRSFKTVKGAKNAVQRAALRSGRKICAQKQYKTGKPFKLYCCKRHKGTGVLVCSGGEIVRRKR